MIALAREYACIFGAPIIRAVDPAIFTYRYFTHCMSCNFCGDACCSYGVDIDVENMARLTALGPDFAATVGISPEEWFESETEADAEFPGGAAGRTRAVDGACIFLDRKQRGCKIHAYSIANGIDYHQLKPLVSVLFPLTFEQGVLVASGEVEDKSLICGGQGPSLYDGARDELAYYFGDAFVAELDSIRARA
jgi:Putative zinc- or iron-chelating domain